MPLVPACFASPAIGNFLQGEDKKAKLLYLFKKQIQEFLFYSPSGR